MYRDQGQGRYKVVLLLVSCPDYLTQLAKVSDSMNRGQDKEKMYKNKGFINYTGTNTQHLILVKSALSLMSHIAHVTSTSS